MPGFYERKHSREAELKAARATPPGNGGATTPLNGNAGPYGAKALAAETTNVLNAPEGVRNDTLNRAAFNLGTLIPIGVIAEADAQQALSDAGLAAGLEPREVAATVRSGLTAGAQHPRQQPTTNGHHPHTTASTAPPPDTATPTGNVQPDQSEVRKRLLDGAAFILDVPDKIPTVWGDGDQVAWAEGESLMLVGPPGVGKTTLSGQILRARLGLLDQVLGMPVAPTEGRILYLAMDRPAQIRRSLRRTFTETDRPVLADKLTAWQGPPPEDLARAPHLLVDLAKLADADTLVLDSLKDAAIGLTEDEVASAYNRARQNALAAGIQLLELHHNVKRGQNGAKPNTLADVYGSTWLTAGAGSVILLWGAAGDPIVEMLHLKQPAAEIGPYRLIHNHVTGETTIHHTADLILLARYNPERGLTAQAAAVALFQKPEPSAAEVEKARRKLDTLTRQGLLERRTVGVAGDNKGGGASTYHPADPLAGSAT